MLAFSLREWKLSDAQDLALVFNNKKVLENLGDGIPYPYTGKEFIASILCSDKNSIFDFAIEVEGKVVGSISVFRQNNIHFRTGELGYYLAEEYWGKGIMTEAVKQICKYVFDNSDIVRIYTQTFARNIGSCRVLEKAGFQFEGLLRSNAIKNGEIIDTKMYAIIK